MLELSCRLEGRKVQSCGITRSLCTSQRSLLSLGTGLVAESEKGHQLVHSFVFIYLKHQHTHLPPNILAQWAYCNVLKSVKLQPVKTNQSQGTQNAIEKRGRVKIKKPEDTQVCKITAKLLQDGHKAVRKGAGWAPPCGGF